MMSGGKIGKFVVGALSFSLSVSAVKADVDREPGAGGVFSSHDWEIRQDLKADIERFVQEEDYKEMRLLCAQEPLRGIRQHRLPGW